MAFGFYDLGGGNLLVINETTSLPYAIQNLYGATLLGGGGSGGPTIKYTVGGAALVPGDQLVGGAASSGTPGSGTAVVGYLVIDSTGHVTANIIPRTNTLASLEALALGVGELASATDIPAIVQGTGTAGVNYAIFPFNSAQGGSFSATGAASGSIPCTSDTVRVVLSGAMTSFVGTLQAGYIDGQVLNVDLVSTPATGMGNVTINGTLIAGGTSLYPSLNIPAVNPVVSATFKWSSTSSTWVMIAYGTVAAALGLWPGALNLPPSNVSSITGLVASGVGALSIGGANTVYAGGNAAFGSGNALLGSTTGVSFAFGHNSTNYNQGLAVGALASVWGTNAINISAAGSGGGAGGSNSLAIGKASTGKTTSGGLPAWIVPTSISFVSGTTYLVSLASTTGIENGMQVLLQLGGVGGVCVASPVTSLIANTSFNVVIKAPASVLATLVIPAWLTNNLTQFVNISDGQSGIAIGAGAWVHNYGAEATATSVIAVQGDSQNGRYRLIGATTDAATVTPLTLSGGGANTNINVGLSNRFIPATGQTIAATLRIVGRDQATGGMVKWTRELCFENVAGTLSITQTPVTLGTDLATGTLAALTFAGSVTVSANATYQSLDVSVTGVAATNIHWMATLTTDEVI